MLPFCGLSVFLSVTFVHCAQMVEDVDPTSVAYNSAESLPDLIKLIWLRLHRSTLPPTKFDPKWIDLRYSMANCGRMARDSTMVTAE